MKDNIFEEYLREKEPQKKEKGYAWQTAIGLQAVDGLETSEYLFDTAKKNIEGDITFEEDGEFVKAVIKTKSDSYKEIGYLYIVGYTEGGARVTTVNMVKVDATTFESVKVAKVPVLDETAVYKAYVWNFTNQPMKSSEMLNK